MPSAEFGWHWLITQLRNPLVLFGFAAQFVFFLRFVVQWLASERRGRSHIPVAFWWLSLLGGVMIFVYAVGRKDLVFMTAQGLSVFIYIRNLILIYGRQARTRQLGRRGFAAAAKAPPPKDPDPRQPERSPRTPRPEASETPPTMS